MRRVTRTIGARLIGLALLGQVGTPDLGAQDLVPRSFPLRRVESFGFRSAVTGRQYDISVGFPVDYRADSEKKYPALLATDGNRTFPLAYAIAEGLMEQGTIEGLFVVSIGTPFELGDSAWVRRRVHEFSPPGWKMEDPFGRVVKGVCDSYRVSPPQADCVGGAPKFLQFIASELVPALTRRFRIAPDRLGLFGISAGGFFASWAIFQPGSPFERYIISSPAMAYGDGEIFRQEERYAAAQKDLAVAIYLASGSLEIDDPMMEGTGRIVSGQVHLSGVLAGRKYPGLRLTSEIHAGLGHVDAGPATLARGLRLLYPGEPRRTSP